MSLIGAVGYEFKKMAEFLVIFGGMLQVHAADLGIRGEVFPVAEKSLLELIHERLKSMTQAKELDAIEQQWALKIAHEVRRPEPMTLPLASVFHQEIYDPSVVLTQDILDANGKLLFAKGKVINPLQQLPWYQPHWMFLDADHPQELTYAKTVMMDQPDLRVILIKGDVVHAGRALGRAVYFDQGGYLVQKFHLKERPALIHRQGNVLQIDYGVSYARP
jgi:conjugal transfer pilus assembly protein TraW